MFRYLITVFLALLCVVPSSGFARPLAVLLLEHEQSSIWMDLLSSGLERGARDFDYETRVVIGAPGTDQEKIFREQAAVADLVLVATDNFHEILRNNAANFRRVKFGCLDAGIRAPNIMSITFADEQASFLAGVAAAMHAQTATARPSLPGWLSGADSPAMQSLLEGYRTGVNLVSPDLKIAQALCGSFTDPAAAKAKTVWLLENGASVIALAAGAGNPAALQALAGKAAFIALDGPTPNSAPLGVISKKMDRAVYEILQAVATNKFRGKEIITYDLANGGVNFELSASYMAEAGAQARNINRRLAELRAEIARKTVNLRSKRARTLCDCLD